MAATITTFISALHAPCDYLNTLVEAKVISEVSRTKNFADVQILWNDKRYLLSMPLTPEALQMAQLAAIKLRMCRSLLLLDYRVLPGEMNYLNSRGQLCNMDLLLQECPEGDLLCDVIKKLDTEQLFDAVDRMEAEFVRLKLVHSNLKAENIIIGRDGQLYPIRLHYVNLGRECHADFDELRAYIAHTLKSPLREFLCDAATSEPLNALYGYSYVGNPFEGMCVAESNLGYGYIDTDGREIIPPQYLWAGDMREGRAEVETASGMGLINARGNYVIPPQYQIVEFNPHTCLSRAKQNDEWLTFDYEGCLV